MKQSLCAITSNLEVAPGTYLMWVEAPDMAARARPGQFVTVKCADFILRRPLAVHQTGSNNILAGHGKISTEQSQIALLFKVTGKGTLWLSQRQENEELDILGPFGNGFSIPGPSKHLLLVAGGIGIAPLIFLMQHASSRRQVTLIHGVPSSTQLYSQRYLSNDLDYRGIQFIPVTEDGSTGRKGMATQILPDFLDSADQVYACGPVEMYKAMTELSLSGNPKLEKCQVSLEVRMGCSFGACFGCTIDTRNGLKRVCRDGPVFELGDIIWQEVNI